MPSKKTPAEKAVVEKPPVKDKPSNGTPAAKPGSAPKGKKVQKPAKAAAKKTATAPKKKAATTRKTTPKAAKKSPQPTHTTEFRLRFHTEFGQTLLVCGNVAALGEMDPAKALPLQYLDNQHWQVEIPTAAGEKFQYQYILQQKDGSLVYDWGVREYDRTGSAAARLLVIDSWNHAGFFENAFYTEPFRDVLLEKTAYAGNKTPRKVTHNFRVKAPLLKANEAICVVGAGSAFGNWNTGKPLLLSKTADQDDWSISLDLAGVDYILEYKYGVYDTVNNNFVRYEAGGNRFVQAAAPGQQINVNDGFVVLPADQWKGAGIAVPVFSLRTNRSFGVGEFTDLKLLVDWAKQTGFRMIQLLPVNDTSATHTWKDSYPYAAISAFALHPIFLDLEKITEPKNQGLLKKLDEKRKELNNASTVNYCEVIREKWQYIEKIYPLQKAATFKKEDFKSFFQANEHWLVPYAVFCYLKDEYGTSDFNQWPEYRVYNEAEVAALAKKGSVSHDRINIHFFVQYHLHLQLQEASAYAHENKIILKGDIPIGVYRYGADAWQQPELYHLDVQAGAPPDDFAIKGQNWGFPTYNWERMRQDGFKWWHQRFQQMDYYFDAFRIDHILGFFRIWSIPLHAVEGIMGRFVPAIPVEEKEFYDRGISFDYLRFCRPFITDMVLVEVFGDRSEEVKQTFLDYDGFNQYVMKDEFDTQRKVESWFADKDDQQLKQGLFDLISNVILFEEESTTGGRFHFRFAMQDTPSFRHLDAVTRHKLQDHYVDYFFHRQDHHWELEARQKLPGLKRATNMLVCGEDLGLVPHCVPDVMKQLGILSLEIQRMPKAVNREFFNPAEAPYLSVVTPSTHDMSTIRGWWEEDRETTRKFYHQELRQPGEPPQHCEPWISKAIVLQHLQSPAMWSVFQVQDLLGMSEELRREDPAEERINLPSNPQHYWNYRMHIPLEDLLKAAEFNAELKGFLQSTHRI